MQYSVINKSECSKYDFGNFLFSPDFFLKDKLINWQMLADKSSEVVTDYFLHVKDTCSKINQDVICYDLTDGLPKFFDSGVEVSNIGSTKKVAQEGDFLISRLRSYLQEMGIVEKRPKDQLFSTEFLVFRQKTNKISSSTLFALCMTETVQTILKFGQYGTEHPRFYDFLLANLPFPCCLLKIDSFIHEIVQKALQLRKLSREIYQQTQTILLSELNLSGWQPKRQLTFVKNYSDIEQAKRIDAEYYQPKYGKVINAIHNYSSDYDMLGNLVTIKKCIEVGSSEYLDKGIPFVRVSNINPFELAEEKYISGNLYTKIKQHQPEQGEILFSKDATPGIAYHIREEPKKMIPSGGILRLRLTDERVNGDYLTLVLNSLPTQEQINRDVGGSVILHWRPDQVKEIVIPILPKEKQAQIEKKIAESFSIRKQSKHLLECAKRAVEIAIEQDEQTAIKWLKSETEKMTDMSIS